MRNPFRKNKLVQISNYEVPDNLPSFDVDNLSHLEEICKKEPIFETNSEFVSFTKKGIFRVFKGGKNVRIIPVLDLMIREDITLCRSKVTFGELKRIAVFFNTDHVLFCKGTYYLSMGHSVFYAEENSPDDSDIFVLKEKEVLKQ